MRLRQRGMPSLQPGHGKGDHFITFDVQLPRKLTAEQRRLMKEFALTETSIKGTVNGVKFGTSLTMHFARCFT